ncbi:membrane protein [Streptomyces sp. WM6372]|uniref:DUF3152 domain-containing protein n=1 Tax=Streptomyces sp. WM6372 TaxID=1415555 RepID=UPI0006AEEACA|nr:DUF3152 domain-containing protein [Streptomyces sp. WM6372]KOU16303.1 membrane protein [Streptomyces sp. WM6372]
MPAGKPTGHGQRSRLGPRAQRRAERRKRLRRTLLGTAAAVAVAATAYAVVPLDDASSASDSVAASPSGTPGAASGEPGRVPAAAAASPSASAGSAAPGEPSADASKPSGGAGGGPAAGKTPQSGPGTFAASSHSGQPQGKGTARKWRIEVEEGSGVDANAAAQSVEKILGDPRGWIKDPAYGFQLVGAGQPVDFTVKIATPTTTDRLCEVVTPELIGETNCRAGHTVVVNLKRWLEGSPQFKGAVEEYRALIVNHEVGHELGHDHETCPGPGKPAPAMMQQIKGLLGCKANAWPFDGNGTYLSGPPVP